MFSKKVRVYVGNFVVAQYNIFEFAPAAEHEICKYRWFIVETRNFASILSLVTFLCIINFVHKDNIFA